MQLNIAPGAKLQKAPLRIFNLKILHLLDIIFDDCFDYNMKAVKDFVNKI
jgi:hypothetical protein